MPSETTTLRGSQSPWTCRYCKKPIAPGDGAIEIRERSLEGAIGGYPKRPTPESSASDVSAALTEEALTDMIYGRVDMTPTHFECDPHQGNSSYQITTERAATLEQWCSWVLHLHEKNWMGRDDLHRMLTVWFTNRGIKFGSLA